MSDSPAIFSQAVDIALVRACEERIVNCWPAVATMLIDGFVVRFANGYSGRANSASPIEFGADLSDERLDMIEGLYRDANLPSVVRVTALAEPRLELRLMARGYRLRDQSFGIIAPIGEIAVVEGADIRIAPRPEKAWLDGVSALQSPDKQNPSHLEAIVGRIRVPAGFASVFENGQPIGYGMTAIDRGMAEIGSIIIVPDMRGRGIGEALVISLMAHARALGAHSAFLQVEQENASAVRLYRRLGFTFVYAYRTLIRDL